MSGQLDQPDNFLIKLKSELNSIFEELTSIYDRGSKTKSSDISRTYRDVIKGMAEMISSYWDIPSHMICSDLENEKNRQETNQTGIPNIPTYQIRFTLEEGAWIILLRENYRSMVKNSFNRLLSLEEMIWDTGAGTREDIAYYLIELDQLSNSIVNPLVEFWVNQHDYGTFEDFAPILISAYHGFTIDQGQNMYTGGKRLIKSKVSRIKEVLTIDYLSSWTKHAKSIASIIKDDISNDLLSEQTKFYILTLSIFHKEVILSRQSSDLHKSQKQKSNINSVWNELDYSDFNSKNLFRENILRFLYQQQEGDPTNAAFSFIDNMVEQSIISKEKCSEIKIDLAQRISHAISKLQREEEKDKTAIEIIQNFIPKTLIQCNKEMKLQEQNKLNKENLGELQIWDVFSENIRRTKRLDDPLLISKTRRKAINMVYSFLIEMKIPPIESGTIIYKYISKEFGEFENIEKIELDFLNLTREDSLSLKELDDKILILLSNFLMRILG